MEKGYRIDYSLIEKSLKIKEYTNKGNEIFKKQEEELEEHKEIMVKSLRKEILNSKNNPLNAENIQNNWFPEIKADVFLSHAHIDKDKIITIAGWLKTEYNLDAFFDFGVWGYGNDLLQIIDDKYSTFPNNKSLYDYNKRNDSTAHIHLLTITSLAKMINSTKYFLFVETKKSVNTAINSWKESQNPERKITYSPWIYYELLLSKILKKEGIVSITESVQMEFDVSKELEHLEEIESIKVKRYFQYDV